MKRLLTIGFLAAFCLTGTFSYASGNLNSEDFAEGIIEINEAYSAKAMTKAERRAEKRANKMALRADKRAIKMEKRAAKMNRMLEKYMSKKALGGLDDPIDKFLWWAIIAAGAAIIFSFIFWPLSTIFWIGSIVLLVLWIIKKYG